MSFQCPKKGNLERWKKVLRCKFASWKAADGFRRCFKAVIALGTWHLHGVTFRPKYIAFRGVTFLLSLLDSRVSYFDVKIQIFEVGCNKTPEKRKVWFKLPIVKIEIQYILQTLQHAFVMNTDMFKSVPPKSIEDW